MKNFVERSVKGKKEKRNKLIEEYFIESESTMNYKDFENICKTPFLHMKRQLSTGKLFEFRFKYLGKFSPTPSKVMSLLKFSQDSYDKGKMDQTTYNMNVLMTTDYISTNASLFKKYSKDLEKWIRI